MARKIRIRLVKPSPLVMAALLAVIVFCTVAIAAIRSENKRVDAENELLRLEAAGLLADNQQMSQRIASLGTVESAIQIAMEQLGLVLPDTVIVEPGN